ncbi:hypothetical protein AB1K62_02570 [Parasphingorhabdus sp. JC815]|uniref:hypothetical protein n=1 Tax=Parasphingorhabdus sp. JC815 TaxID=3232140 RepID=UPI003459BA0B
MHQNPGVGLVQQAAATGITSAYISDDFAAALFPKSDIILSDRILSNGRQYLQAIVRQIETEICVIAAEDFGLTHDMIIEIGNNDRGHSYPLLQNAGLLETKILLEHVFTCVQREELGARLLRKISQAELESVLVRHLDNEDQAIADAAMALLVAQSRDNSGSAAIHAHIANLPAEILFALTWPIVAAVQKLSGYDGPDLKKAAEKLLSRHDESGGTQRRAQRLAQFVDQLDENLHPLHDGLDLFLARMALRSGLSVNQLILFTAEPQMMRLVLAMRTMDMSADQAMSIFGVLEGGGQLLTRASYNEIDREQAADLVKKWSSNILYQDAQRRLNTPYTGLAD